MKLFPHLTLAITALLIVSLAGCGSTVVSQHGSRSAETVQQLARQADAWDQAIVLKDRAAIESNMSDDFRQIDGDADIETKASFVAGLVSPKLTIDPYTVEDFEVRLYGDVALLSGRTRMTGTYDGKAFASHYRYIDVYLRTQGTWKIASVQITKLPK